MSRLLDFSDGFTSATEPTIQGGLSVSKLRTFASDAAFEADKGAAADPGDIYLNTADNMVHFYNNTGWNSWYVERYLATYNIAAPQAANTDMTLLSSGNYVVGSNQLFISLNGQLLAEGIDYLEIGSPGDISTSIEMIWSLEVGDVVIIRK